MEPKKKAPARPRARKKKASAEPATRGLAATDMYASGEVPAEVRALWTAVEADQGRVLASYREPLGGSWLVLASLPTSRVEPTPFQRDLSAAHVERLRTVIDKIDRFLDPIIVVRDVVNEAPHYWTPNGHHRLAAMKQLGARAITALLVPDAAIAYRILALNTEKAHNLRERALEVMRMYRDLATRSPERRESDLALEFEEASLITVGFSYEARPRFSGGAYHPLVRRVDAFLDGPLGETLAVRQERSRRLLALDDRVAEKVEALRTQGLQSPYLRNFVVARINPLRFQRGATMGFDEAMEKALASAEKLDVTKVRAHDLAGAGGPPDEAGE